MKTLYIAIVLLPFSLGFSAPVDISGSYKCQQKSKITHETREYTLFVKKTSTPGHYRVLFEIPEVGQFKSEAFETQTPNFYFSKWQAQTNDKISGLERWKILPNKDGAIKGYYLGFDAKTQTIHEGKIKCEPIYD